MVKEKLDTLRELVPLYVQGELAEADRVRFEDGLQQYPELQDDILACSSIESYYREIETQTSPPTNRAFEVISQSITQRNDPRVIEKEKFISLKKVKERFAEFFTIPQLGWGVAVVQCAVIVLLLLPGQRQSQYKTLTSLETSVDHLVTLQVVFAETTTEKEIRQIINTINGEITGGPTAEGMYTIGLQKSSDVNSIITLLRTKKNILFVEKAL